MGSNIYNLLFGVTFAAFLAVASAVVSSVSSSIYPINETAWYQSQRWLPKQVYPTFANCGSASVTVCADDVVLESDTNYLTGFEWIVESINESSPIGVQPYYDFSDVDYDQIMLCVPRDGTSRTIACGLGSTTVAMRKPGGHYGKLKQYLALSPCDKTTCTTLRVSLTASVFPLQCPPADTSRCYETFTIAHGRCDSPTIAATYPLCAPS